MRHTPKWAWAALIVGAFVLGYVVYRRRQAAQQQAAQDAATLQAALAQQTQANDASGIPSGYYFPDFSGGGGGGGGGIGAATNGGIVSQTSIPSVPSVPSFSARDTMPSADQPPVMSGPASGAYRPSGQRIL